jgi:PAS domain S-box-containing protein
MTLSEKILLVDDDPAVLDGLRRVQHGMKIETAVGGECGLEILQTNGPFAVVVSDMRMPLMDGVQFLAKVKAFAPSTVRMMLTGHADLDTAIAAVNEGSIFRFLTKPCSKETFKTAIHDALAQHRSAMAERSLLEKTSAVWEWDLATGPVWRNGNFEGQFGFPPTTTGREHAVWNDLIHPEDRDQARTRLHDALDRHADSYDVEYRLRRIDGSYAAVLDRASIIYDKSGHPLRLVGAMTDLSELRRLEEQFRQAQKLEALGQLAGGVAHDFNNLLMVISSYTQMIQDQAGLDEKVRPYALEVLKASERAKHLTQQLLAFSRRQAISPRVVDLNGVVEETTKMARRLIAENIELTVSPGRPLPLVLVDPDQAAQALLNLCVNARDAMPKGGMLTIATQSISIGSESAEEDLHPLDEYTLLTVTDSGLGMTQETQARIFEPFFTTKELGKGTGLGLSMVHGFVKQSGGFIRVDSHPGRGSSFNLYFPAAKTPLAALTAPEIRPAEGKGETEIRNETV